MPPFDFFKKSTTQATVAKPNPYSGISMSELLQALSLPFQQFISYNVKDAADKYFIQTEIVYRCVRIISEQLSTLAYVVYDKNGNEVENHPVAEMLWRPNNIMSPWDFKNLLWMHAELTGSAFFWMPPVKVNGRRELLPLYPDKVEIIASTEQGKLIAGYRYDNKVTLVPSEVLHFKYINPADGLDGVPPLKAALSQVEIVKQQDLWNFNSFKNRGVPSMGILLDSENVTAETIKAVKESIKRQTSGPDNARAPIVLPGGRKIERMGQTAVELDFTASRKAAVEAISVAFGVPLPMLGIYDNGTFSNVETAGKDFWENTLLPKANGFCNAASWFFENAGLLKQGEWLGFNKAGIKALQRNASERVKDAVTLFNAMSNAGFDPQASLEMLNRTYELGLTLDDIGFVEADAAFVPTANAEP